jgi:hypothetical protein
MAAVDENSRRGEGQGKEYNWGFHTDLLRLIHQQCAEVNGLRWKFSDLFYDNQGNGYL